MNSLPARTQVVSEVVINGSARTVSTLTDRETLHCVRYLLQAQMRESGSTLFNESVPFREAIAAVAEAYYVETDSVLDVGRMP